MKNPVKHTRSYYSMSMTVLSSLVRSPSETQALVTPSRPSARQEATPPIAVWFPDECSMSVPVIVSRESSNSQTSPKISTSRRQLPEPPSPKGTPASTPETPTDDVVVEFRRPGHARREVVTRTSPVRRREEHKRLVDGRHYREHCILME